MLESLQAGVLLALETPSIRTDAPEKVQELLSGRFFAQIQNTGALPVLPEFRLGEMMQRYKFPRELIATLRASRVVAYGQGDDKRGLNRVAVLYYDAHDTLKLVEVQEGIPFYRTITREGLDDAIIVEQFLDAGFVSCLPAGAYPETEEL